MLARGLARNYGFQHTNSKLSIRMLTSSSSKWEEVFRRDGTRAYYNYHTNETVSQEPAGFKRKGASPSEHIDSSLVTPQEEEEAIVPIDFDQAAKIEGHESQIVHIDIQPQQRLRAETGSMIYMSEGIDISTSTAGGFGKGLKRLITGENFFVSDFTYTGSAKTKGTVAFGTNFPSKILRIRLNEQFDNSIICQKGAFLCGSSTINIEIEVAKKMGVGFFGGEGFVLQRLTGDGDAFIKAGGTLIERTLASGEVLRISSGCLVAFEPSVAYDISMMKGFKNVMFGGEGLFITTLTGPGKIYLQGQPFDRTVDAIARRIPGGGSSFFMPMGFGGGGGGASDVGEVSDDVGGSADTGAEDTSSGNSDNIYGAVNDSPNESFSDPNEWDHSRSSFSDSTSNNVETEMWGQDTGTTDFDSFKEEVWGQDTGTSTPDLGEQGGEDSIVSQAFGFLKDFFGGNDN